MRMKDLQASLHHLQILTQKLSQLGSGQGPWDHLQHLQNLLDDDFWSHIQGIQRLAATLPASASSDEDLAVDGSPQIDVYQTHSKVIVSCAIPGAERTSLRASLTDGRVLTLEGVVKENAFVQNKGFVVQQERFFGKFIRRIPLPAPVKAEGVVSTYRDGILDLHFPKAEPTSGKTVRISL